MKIVTAYAELQMNPRNITAYRDLIEHYEGQNMLNEAEAFRQLIKRKFDADNPNAD